MVVPSAAAAPAGAVCVTKAGAPVAPGPGPSPTTVGAPVLLTPTPVGPVVPAPVQDIVIEQPTPVPPGSRLTPLPTLPVQPVSPAVPALVTPLPSSPPRRPRPAPTPTSVPLDAGLPTTGPLGGVVARPPVAPGVPADDNGSGSDAQPGTAVSSDNQPGAAAGFDARPGAAAGFDGQPGSALDRSAGDPTVNDSAAVSPGVRTLPGVLLGPAVADYFGNVVSTDPSVLLPGKLFLGGSFVLLLGSDGAALSADNVPFSFTLSPEAAAPLAGSGRAGPFRVFALNPNTSSFDELPTILVLHDDGSVTVTVLQAAPAFGESSNGMGATEMSSDAVAPEADVAQPEWAAADADVQPDSASTDAPGEPTANADALSGLMPTTDEPTTD